MSVTITGNLATIAFDRFDLDQYRLFLQTKQLPESQVTYDWEADRYEVTTPARFAALLGMAGSTREADRLDPAPHLFDYQRWTVAQALDAKRFAAWLDTGLGKTAVYLEWARQVRRLTGARVLILTPLGIIPQVIEEAQRFYGEDLLIERLTTRQELIDWLPQDGPAVGICNYEKFIPGEIPELRFLGGLVADEASLLRTGGGVIKWNLIHSAKGIEYKLACTATPAPNDAMEYASQAAFLEKLRNEGEILWTYFQRDKFNNWFIKPHAKHAFYRFMASWSLYMRDPVRFGFEDILSSLPDPVIREQRIAMTDAQRVQMQDIATKAGMGLWADQKLGVVPRTKLAQIARGFLYEGSSKNRKIERIDSLKPGSVAVLTEQHVDLGRQTIVWTAFDEEGEIVREKLAALGVPAEVLTGKQTETQRMAILERFRAGEIRALISKPVLLGFGLNFQFVRAMVFSGFDDSFERMYQAIRRAYRFGQTETVHVDIPYIPELEGVVFDNIRSKEARFLEEVAAQELAYQAAVEDLAA